MSEDKSALAVITENELMDYVKTFAGTSALTVGETKQFIHVAQAFNLNPFKREIYAIPYEKSIKLPNGQWGKERQLSIITGYDVYLKRAERTSRLDGWEVSTEGSGDDMRAILTIYRKDWTHPFKHEIYFAEVAKKDRDGKPQSMWKTMPRFMLKKVAVAQGFRLAFPDEFGGMPYTSDELPENMTKGFVPSSEEPATAKTEIDGVPGEATYIPPMKEDHAPAQNQNAPAQKQPETGAKDLPYMLKDGEEVPAWFMALAGAEKIKWAPKGFSIRGGKICVHKAS